MARARIIKPQFLRSRSMRRVSRDAQLTFIRLWLAADDAGRLREGVHGMGYTLYPGDEESQRGVAAWLAELEREHCIERYTVDGGNYMRVVNWRRHQKIYHPTPSRLPARPSGPTRGVEPAAEEEAAREGVTSPSGAPHESLGREREKPLRVGLFGRFHERFLRRRLFFFGRPVDVNTCSRKVPLTFT
jgi:hypothetical protein